MNTLPSGHGKNNKSGNRMSVSGNRGIWLKLKKLRREQSKSGNMKRNSTEQSKRIDLHLQSHPLRKNGRQRYLQGGRKKMNNRR
jgi:hypothetical protein